MKTDAGNDENYAGNQDGMFSQVVEQTNAQFQGFDTLTEATLALQSVVDGLGDSLGNVFASILDGTQSGSKAFKAMGHAIFSDMTQLASKMLANQLLKQLFTWIGGAFAGGLGSGSGTAMAGGPNLNSGVMASYTGGEVMANYGGAFAGGGEITSGVATRDSTYIHAAKGEFMLRKEAVDAIGVDTANSLNNLNKGSAKNARALNAKSTETRPLFAPQVTTSVYMLDKTTPPPSMGPNEVLAVFNDDVVRNGRSKTLIKQIISGAL
jgi:hypothetical protein